MAELVACTDLGEWDRLVSRHSRATVFHRSAWLGLVSQLTGARLHPFFVTQAGAIAGVLPVFVFRRGPLRVAASPPAQAATPYLGPLVDDALMGETLEAFVRTARAMGASYVEFRVDREIPPSVLTAAHLARDTRATFLLDLGPGPEVLWRTHLSAACRRA